MNSFIIYQIDISSNPQFVSAIGGMKDNKADLVVFSYRQNEYTRLNRKLTRSLISQFIKANLKNDRRLKKNDASLLGEVKIKSVKKTVY